MAWRRHEASPGVPERLARFVPSEWPGARCPHDALDSWRQACTDWLDADSGRVLPFGEHGDVIDVLNQSGRYNARMPACAHEIRPGQHWTNGPPGD